MHEDANEPRYATTPSGPPPAARHAHETDGGRRSALAPVLGLAAVGLAAMEVKARREAGGQPFATVRRSVAVRADRSRVYDALAAPGTIAALVRPGAEVMEVSANRWTWRVPLPAGAALTMRSVLTDARPGARLAWRVGEGGAPHEVGLDFVEAPDGDGTVVRAVVDLFPSARVPLLGTRALVEKAADRALATALYRLRALLETGEIPTVDGQPSGMGEGGTKGGDAMANGDRGLGKVVYGGDQSSAYREDERLQDGEDLVVEASEESFPASDPPVFSRGAAAAPDVSSDAGQAPG